jgi:hypothetical protein
MDILDMNGTAGSDLGIHIGDATVGGTGRIRVNHNGNVIAAASGPLVTLNTWHHLVYTRSGGTGTLYLDNVVAGTGTDSLTLTSTAPMLGIGGKPTSNNRSYAGYIDEFAIYGTAFSASDVDAHYTAVVPIPEPASLAVLGLGGVALLARRRRVM